MMVQDVIMGHEPTLNECIEFAAACGQEPRAVLRKVSPAWAWKGREVERGEANQTSSFP
jgi:hypothetical protein